MVKIVADTTSSLLPSTAAQLGFALLPQIIIFGNDSYRDDTELDQEAFIKKLKSSSVLPKTAAPPPQLYEQVYKEYSEAGHTIIVLTPSSDVSGTFRSATVAAQDFPNADIRVIDTRSMTGSLGHMVLLAHEWAEQGVDADTIIARLDDLRSRERIYALVDTLEYLYKGGRIGGATMLMGSMLQMKPILSFRDGHIEPVDKQRTKQRALARLKELVLADCPPSPDAMLTVCHGENIAEAQAFADELKQVLGLNEIPLMVLPAAILTHAGPATLAVTYFRAPQAA